MKGLRYTLLGDGPSDRLLEYPIRWALTKLGVRVEIGQWADLSRVRGRPHDLADKARAALKLYPAELLLVHRDAENEALERRLDEIRTAVASVARNYVAIVPVRMTEAWLLHDQAAIRRASGNPNGAASLRLPRPGEVENVADPKAVLREALLDASELAGRRRKRREKEFGSMRARAAELITDFLPLRAVPGFACFFDALQGELRRLGHLGAKA